MFTILSSINGPLKINCALIRRTHFARRRARRTRWLSSGTMGVTDFVSRLSRDETLPIEELVKGSEAAVTSGTVR